MANKRIKKWIEKGHDKRKHKKKLFIGKCRKCGGKIVCKNERIAEKVDCHICRKAEESKNV